MKATECLGEIMSDGNINIPENKRQILNWKAGRKVRLIIFSEEATDDFTLKRLLDMGLIKLPKKERIKPLNQRRSIRIKGEPMSKNSNQAKRRKVNIYADSSAVKVYIDETGSERMRNIAFSGENHIFISKITGAEVAAAFSRRKRMNDIAEDDYDQILSDFLSDFEELFVRFEVTDSIVLRAIDFAKTRALRGYDAVQLATAFTLSTEIYDGIIFISADEDLNEAAKAEGLAVENLLTEIM